MNEYRLNELIARESAKPGYKGKINAKCIECSYDPFGQGNWRQQVENCCVPTCPLYPVRPISKPHKSTGDSVKVSEND